MYNAVITGENPIMMFSNTGKKCSYYNNTGVVYEVEKRLIELFEVVIYLYSRSLFLYSIKSDILHVI